MLWQKRINRIIKEEFGINRKIRAKSQAIQLVEESIYLYNTERPYLSLKNENTGTGI
jgi:hypothetical protein